MQRGRQPGHQKSIQHKREEIKSTTKKGELMATFVRTSPISTKMVKARKKRKVDDSFFRKGKKSSVHLIMMMYKGSSMS